MDTQVQRDAQTAIEIARQFIRDELGVPLREIPGMDVAPTVDGFAATLGHALTVVFADWTNCTPMNWSIQMSSCLAIDIPDVSGPLLWANNATRSSAIGKYYCAIAQQQGLSAIVYETTAWGGFISEGIEEHRMLPGSWLKGLLKNNIETSAELCETVQQNYGGRFLGPTDADIIALFTMASG